ncbi:MAG TPA: response regulator [Thermoanaerobaculia bacterium]|jgi:DNA-binding NarL/FixJ family response regulator|nr:response regulator [Thermoanaerobaculia bacterium]
MSARNETRGRVLIVDDQHDLLEGMKALLEISGIDVVMHDSMITLPLILREADPDVVLLDVSLPALSSTAALRQGLRRLLRTSALLVLFSGRSPNELAAMTEELGADGFITKSQEPMEIIARIQTLIDHSRLLRTTYRNEASNDATHAASAPAC